MLLGTIVKVGLKSLLANKTRTLLTMLGVIIGVAAVISMLAIGAGAQQQVLERMSSMGTNLLFVHPERIYYGGVRYGARADMKLSDGEALMAEVPEIVRMSPVVSGSLQAKYLDRNTRTTITGVSSTYFVLRNFPIERGRAFNGSEVDDHARVCTLGPRTAEDLFGDEDPLDKVIRVKNVNFRVIGIQASKGDQGWHNPDDVIHIPYTVAMDELFGLENVQQFYIQIAEGSDAAAVEEHIRQVLRRQHRLMSDQEDDFHLRNQAEWIERVMETSRTFTFLLGGIASISLLVGGIGIMNIMLVTVTERTREIGIRKAVGAKERSILLQFLIEALIISSVGGLGGVALGWGGAYALRTLTDFITVVEPHSVVLALTVSGCIGVFFGYYPARRAAVLDPVEALRYE
jgi:putative ABC transport system permease protein